MCIFHTDRGNEFKNHPIDETPGSYEIKRFLSHKGCPYGLRNIGFILKKPTPKN